MKSNALDGGTEEDQIHQGIELILWFKAAVLPAKVLDFWLHTDRPGEHSRPA